MNREEAVTGFTPVHYSVFIESREVLRWLIEMRADVDKRDNYNATVWDYARMLQLMPPHPHMHIPTHLQVRRTHAHTQAHPYTLVSWDLSHTDSVCACVYVCE